MTDQREAWGGAQTQKSSSTLQPLGGVSATSENPRNAETAYFGPPTGVSASPENARHAETADLCCRERMLHSD